MSLNWTFYPFGIARWNAVFGGANPSAREAIAADDDALRGRNPCFILSPDEVSRYSQETPQLLSTAQHGPDLEVRLTADLLTPGRQHPRPHFLP